MSGLSLLLYFTQCGATSLQDEHTEVLTASIAIGSVSRFQEKMYNSVVTFISRV